MATTKNTNPPAVSPGEVPPPDPSTPAATPVVFDWTTLAAPVNMPSKQAPSDIKVDVIRSVPEPIRMRAESSLAVNTAAVAKSKQSTASKPRVDYVWRVQQVPDTEVGQEFIKALDKYAKYRPSDKPIPHSDPASPAGQVTARHGEVTHYVNDDKGIPVAHDGPREGSYLGVRYSVRPLEQRNTTRRLPGTAG